MNKEKIEHKKPQANWLVMVGFVVTAIGLLSMASLAFYDMLFGVDSAAVSDAIKSFTPTWRVTTFISGLFLVCAGTFWSLLIFTFQKNINTQ